MTKLKLYYSSGRLSQHLLWLASVAGVGGLLASRALIALAPVVAVVAVLANPGRRQAWRRYPRNGAAMRAAALVGFLVLSGLYTSAWPVWRHELFRSLPWLAVPLAFTVAVPLTAGQRRVVAALFVLGTAAVGAATLGTYLRHPAEAHEAIRVGQNMQAVTGIFHITFGVMLALSCFGAVLLRRDQAAGRGLRAALLAAGVLAVLTLHVLAYRTGLLAFYAGLLAYAFRQLARRQWWLGVAALALLAVGPWLAYQTLNSVEQRFSATTYDVEQYRQGHDINNYSLSRRLAAVETAAAVIRRHWLVGVGPADTHAAMMAQYRRHDFGLRPENWVEVHNQYLYTMVGGGLVGLLLWLAVVFWPLTQARLRRDPGVVFFLLIEATSMLVTDILSLQLGLNLFVFGYGFLIVARETRYLAAAPESAPPADPAALSAA